MVRKKRRKLVVSRKDPLDTRNNILRDAIVTENKGEARKIHVEEGKYVLQDRIIFKGTQSL